MTGAFPSNGTTVLTVCRTCRPEGEASDEPPGARLARAAVEAMSRADEGSGRVEVRTIACLSACCRSCTASVAAPGKFSYVVGGLVPEDADDLARFALAHAEAPDGVPAWRARPEKIRKNTVARVPPPGEPHALVEEVSAAVDDVQERA